MFVGSSDADSDCGVRARNRNSITATAPDAQPTGKTNYLFNFLKNFFYYNLLIFFQKQTIQIILEIMN